MSRIFARPERALDCAWCCEGSVPSTESELCGGARCLEWPKGLSDAYARDWLLEDKEVIAKMAVKQGWPTNKHGEFKPQCQSCHSNAFTAEYTITGTYNESVIATKAPDGNESDFDDCYPEASDFETTISVRQIRCDGCKRRYSESEFEDECFPSTSDIERLTA